jgi:tetratricopeptide (TPR) repeat protein
LQRVHNPIKTIATLFLLFLIAAGPATQPALSQAVLDLGAADPGVRSAAFDRVWRAGDAVVPLLKEALSSHNPELAAEAATVLRDIEDGLRPGDSQELMDAVAAYHAAAGRARGETIDRIAQSGLRGVMVLAHLHDQETDPVVLAWFSRCIMSIGHEIGPLIRKGDLADADALMDFTVSISNQDYGHDCAAYWLVRGKLPEKLAALRAHHTKFQFALLSAFDKAAGDAAAATRDAQASGQYMLIYKRMEEQGDWPAMAKFLHKDVPDNLNLDPVADRAIIYRLAGLSDDAEKERQLLLHEDDDPKIPDWQRYRQGQTLCLIDDPADGIKKLIATGNAGDAAVLLGTQLDFSAAFALASPAKKGATPSALVLARLAPLYQLVGEPDKMKNAIVTARENSKDYFSWLYTNLAARSLGFNDQADQCFLDAVKAGLPSDQTCYLTNESLYTDRPDADWWRRFLLTQKMDQRAALHQARAIVDGNCPTGKLLPFCQQMEQWSKTQSNGDRPNILGVIATTLEKGGQRAAAADVYERCAQAFPSVSTWMAVGDCQSRIEKWRAAADAYARAITLDPSAALPLFLHGWALTREGDSRTGRAEMNESHLIALGDVKTRAALFHAAADRGLDDDARLERKILLVTAEIDDYSMGELLQSFAIDDWLQHKRYGDAAREMLLTMLGNTGTDTSWVEPEDYVTIPSAVHWYNAMDEFGHHKNPAALADAQLAIADWPADRDGAIELVRAADAAGATAGANALFDLADAKYSLVASQFPNSTNLANQAAWFEARCRRNLDNALVHARHAVDLAPKNTDILRTLAETYYQRHEFQHAMETLQKCLKIDPANSWAKSQSPRFQLALKTGVADNN